MTHRMTALAVAIALAATITSGVTAVAVTRTTTVKGCANSHDLLVAAHGKHCAKGSHPVKLGTRGPKGPRGAPGTPGVSGTDATAPTTKVYLGEDDSLNDTPFAGQLKSVIATMPVPVGTYEVSWGVDGDNEASTAGLNSSLSCQVAATQTMSVPTSETLNAGQTTMLSQAGIVIVATAPTPVVVSCSSEGSGKVVSDNAYLVANPVDTVVGP
jgi:hypothetical protein